MTDHSINGEFEKWYTCENGTLFKGIGFFDADNWLTKTNNLDGSTIRTLLYYVAKDKDGLEYVGASEVTGIKEMK